MFDDQKARGQKVFGGVGGAYVRMSQSVCAGQSTANVKKGPEEPGNIDANKSFVAYDP